MTLIRFKHAAYGLIGLSLVFVFLGVQMRGSGTPSAALTTSAQAPPTTPNPTRTRYNCGDIDSPDPITFKWTGRRPNGGWVGEVTYGNIVNKPIQVYDAKVDNNRQFTDWGFQAQDGSFVCRMFVSPVGLKRNIWFGSCRNNNWPQPSCGTDRFTEPPPNQP